MTLKKKTLALFILDGWGYKEDKTNNAVACANTPNLDRLTREYASTLISGSGIDVGLPPGQMGNSEVGHVNLGAGRVVYQDFTKITKAIEDGSFVNNEVLTTAIDSAAKNSKALHIMGLLSDGGVHSHQDHLMAVAELASARGVSKIYLHGFLDGRDTPPQSAEKFVGQAQQVLSSIKGAQIATLIGRYYAMDRDNRWDRVELAYNMLVNGDAEFHTDSAQQGVAESYARGQSDEFVKPTVVGDYSGMQSGDTVLFMNFRADRARELSHALITQDFKGFTRDSKANINFVMLTEYESTLKAPVAYPSQDIVNSMGEWLSSHHKTQLRISETEKFAHVTFFYSGGKEDEYEGEKRILIPSPDVATYDLQPEMNSEKLTDALIEAIDAGSFDVIICNFPNGDMVGHTGNFEAAVKACEAVDGCIGRLVEALSRNHGECIITADHGNAEQMQDPNTGVAHTAHTSEPVPFIYFGRAATTRNDGTLSDVAPTMLHLMGMEQPTQMTGTPIVTLK
ncbi:phosphoglycerate mutase (2,3-diphosphoglycerate-independent) [Glaciecola punicea]|jgi:2,3-bisphosphoglycerate-independent phosphoglycerate mutase|uniref:2,3-bisphosphoglycerate-independent phosphoglycerate mutase n=1 Tax=Glaciecola punicea TaxID=56804 RepID=UPI0008725F7A|nr:2,3-bisphosphoglycerate-independent phosphoglycerate mutase [Glaciecola punicea]OFA32701.1 phosphoglycerate mutase (2,3-diphosphoglycerate-independent) [Glaciecola punicea]